jgi:hypothetical protein
MSMLSASTFLRLQFFLLMPEEHIRDTTPEHHSEGSIQEEHSIEQYECVERSVEIPMEF